MSTALHHISLGLRIIFLCNKNRIQYIFIILKLVSPTSLTLVILSNIYRFLQISMLSSPHWIIFFFSIGKRLFHQLYDGTVIISRTMLYLLLSIMHTMFQQHIMYTTIYLYHSYYLLNARLIAIRKTKVIQLYSTILP